MFEKLQQLESQYEKLKNEMDHLEVISNHKEYQRRARELTTLAPLIENYLKYKQVLGEIREGEELLEDHDESIRGAAREEIKRLEQEKSALEEKLKILLLPRDPYDDHNIILEIRAGTGGEEAALFAGDLLRMFSRYAEKRGWKMELLSHHPTGKGGFKEVIASIDGKGAYSRLKYESGVHRVQRVPVTESQGRIHTSAVTVAVLPEADEVDVQLDLERDLKIDFFRSSAPGGQHVNKTSSAVRITHLPTGLVVSCQDEKSQHKNRAKALKVLRARLLDMKRAEQQREISQIRKALIGSGDRSEKIRTYNFPQGRVTDHRIGLNLYRLEEIIDGNLDEIIDPLIINYQTKALQEQSQSLKPSESSSKIDSLTYSH